MRTKLFGSYGANSSFELRQDDGLLHRTVEPNEILRIGNSIGGFWAKPITYAGQQMLSLVQIGGSKLNWPTERIRRSFGKERGTILQPGLGLWAETSGAARRGVWHRIREDADPIRNALRSMGLPSNLVRTVDEIDEEVFQGGMLCSHLSRGGRSSWSLTDGITKEIEPASYVMQDTCQGNQYHIGCPDGPARVRVTGGSYLIKGANVSRSNIYFAHPTVFEVLVTSKADRDFVAKLVKTGNRCDEVQAVEVEYGLRCPVCMREGCNAASHEVEETRKAARERVVRERAQVVEQSGEQYRLLATARPSESWPYGAKVLERVRDGAAFLSNASRLREMVGNPTKTMWIAGGRIDLALLVIDQESGLEWEVSGGRWQLERCRHPTIL